MYVFPLAGSPTMTMTAGGLDRLGIVPRRKTEERICNIVRFCENMESLYHSFHNMDEHLRDPVKKYCELKKEKLCGKMTGK